MARALWFELPEIYRLLVAGEISEYVASLVVAETRHLDATTRGEVDSQITAAGIWQMGPRSPRRAPASMPMKRTRWGMCNAAGPNGGTVGSACGRRRTR